MLIGGIKRKIGLKWVNYVHKIQDLNVDRILNTLLKRALYKQCLEFNFFTVFSSEDPNKNENDCHPCPS